MSAYFFVNAVSNGNKCMDNIGVCKISETYFKLCAGFIFYFRLRCINVISGYTNFTLKSCLWFVSIGNE